MLSKEMYNLLVAFPRRSDWIPYEKLNPSNDSNIYNLVCTAVHSDYEYLNKEGITLEKSEFSLTEKGQVAIELYEQNEENNRIVAQSLKVAEESLKVAIVAKWAAIASAIAAFLALLPVLINFLNTLFTKQ